MRHSILIVLLSFLLPLATNAQEVLLPLSSAPRQTPKSTDTLLLELPFFDDFAEYEGSPDARRWLSTQAFVNKDYAPQPPSVGVVTLDALDQNGNLYPQASTNLFTADTLASQVIRLDSLTGAYKRKLTPADSVYLSFYYLPGGWYGNMWERVGDTPQPQDSLLLEFYTSIDSSWHAVWAIGGHDADTAGISTKWPWKYVAIKITDEIFFTKEFRFRFRNYASLDANPKNGIAGNCDHWNLDYIYLSHNRSCGDSLYRDVAFVRKAPSMLANYQAMPARQYRSHHMATELDMLIVNRYNQTLASNYSYTVYNASGQALNHYDGGYENIPSFYPDGRYQEMGVHSNPPIQFSFPESNNSASYRIVHVVREGVGGDNHTGNDTLVFTQTFDNYYAYDDGTAENGYGLTNTGSKVFIANAYSLTVEDTLTAVDIYFNRTRNGENENVRFQLCVWKDEGGKPGELLYKEDTKMEPAFEGLNRFHRYILSEPVVVSGDIFVGFEQLSNDYINIGFDRNTDSRDKICYRTSNDWQHSILMGSLMMRPLFGTDATVAVATVENSLSVSLYPNPAQSTVNILCNGNSEDIILSLYDIRGRLLWTQPYTATLSVDTIPSGIYLLRIEGKTTGSVIHRKLIINR